MDIEKIIHNNREEYEEELLKLKEEGWKLEESTKDYAKFKNDFSILMNSTTCYLKAAMLPDYIECHYSTKQIE